MKDAEKRARQFKLKGVRHCGDSGRLVGRSQLYIPIRGLMFTCVFEARAILPTISTIDTKDREREQDNTSVEALDI